MGRQKDRTVVIIAYVAGKKIGPDGLPIPCLDCGKIFSGIQMHFDHVRGEKVENLSIAARKRWSFRRIDEEIRKCDLVCVGCHRLRTHSRFPYQMDPKKWEPTGIIHLCKRCGSEYDRGFFHFSDGRICWCLRCEHLRRVKRRRIRYSFVDSLKAGPCGLCRKSFDPILMDFDHTNPSEKTFSISHGVRLNISVERLKEEIGKCRLLCVWCHVLKTHETDGTEKAA